MPIVNFETSYTEALVEILKFINSYSCLRKTRNSTNALRMPPVSAQLFSKQEILIILPEVAVKI